MTKTWWMLAALTLTGTTFATQALADDDARARKMMEEAFNRRYHWNESFKGFSADFALQRDGKDRQRNHQGLRDQAHGGVTVECDDADAKKLVSDVLSSTVTHTRGSSFSKGFGSCSFAIAGEGAHGGTKIALDRPWFLQGLHDQGRQYHRESRRPW